jgi:hypothetical protein
MPRSMVGLLAAVGTAMSALAGLVHGDFALLIIAYAAAAAGLAAYLALPGNKKNPVTYRMVRHAYQAVCRTSRWRPVLVMAATFCPAGARLQPARSSQAFTMEQREGNRTHMTSLEDR